MDRRSFLASVAAAAALRPAIIDSHVHFYDPSRPQGVPWPLNRSLKNGQIK
jgi:predicted TIM-barrel fold metal-dependent hydrolase